MKRKKLFSGVYDKSKSWTPDKKQKTKHKKGKGMGHKVPRKMGKKERADVLGDLPLRPTGRPATENRADFALRQLRGE